MKENDNFSCWCKAVRVNSSPTVTWMKNGRVLGEPSSTGQELDLRNVSNEASGIYVCRAEFYQLIDEEMIAITVQCKSFLNVYFCLLYFTSQYLLSPKMHCLHAKIFFISTRP